MVNTHFVTVLFVIIYLPAWTRPRQGRRKPCILRGILPLNLRKMGPKQSEILESLPDLNLGPKRTNKYDPSYGYEPYWEKGEWVFEPLEPKEDDMCGMRCNPVYQKYGVVCARNKEFKHQTFDSYCAMRAIDCNNTQGWLIAYRGECQKELRTYPTAAKQIVTRAMQWLNDFSAKYYG